jgi:hypothetical protein
MRSLLLLPSAFAMFGASFTGIQVLPQTAAFFFHTSANIPVDARAKCGLENLRGTKDMVRLLFFIDTISAQHAVRST